MSVFVPGKQHDLFVSYAHANNQPPAGGNERDGWCGLLVEELKRRLAEEIGRRFDRPCQPFAGNRMVKRECACVQRGAINNSQEFTRPQSVTRIDSP